MSAPISSSPPKAPPPKPPAPKPAESKPAPKPAQAGEAKKKEAPKSEGTEARKPETATKPQADRVTRSAESQDKKPEGMVSKERAQQFQGFTDNFGEADQKVGGKVGQRPEGGFNASGAWGGPDGTFDDTPSGEAPKPNTDQNTTAQPPKGTTTVTIEPWGQGEGKNDSVWNSLKNQGYTDQQIADGNLVDQVAQTNHLEDPNVVNPGQQLQIPTLQPPTPPTTEAPRPGEAPKPMTAAELDRNSDPQALKDREAAVNFNQNFNVFDAAADKDHRTDGKVSKLDIEAVARSNNVDDRTKAAAQYYLDNPEALQRLDQAGAADKDKGKGDNTIAKTDAEANVNAANQRVRDTGRTEEQRKEYDANRNRVNDNSLQTLEENYGSLAGKNGKFDTYDLSRVAHDEKADPKLRDAAQFMINNPDRMNSADAASDPGRKHDGTFTMGDLQAARVDTFNEIRKNPDAQRAQEVQQQQQTQWETPQAALENLKKNPDLSTYSDAQLASLAVLAQSDPQARNQIASATGTYVNDRTNSVDDIPGNPGFQVLLSQQVVSPQNLDALSPEARKTVEAAQGTLKNEVNTNIRETFANNLNGKKGDGQVDEALKNFQTGVLGSAKSNPALAPLFKDGLEGLGKDEAIGEFLRKERQADDGPLGQLTDALGGGLKTGFEWVGDKLGDAAEFGFQTTGAGLPATLLTEGLNMAGIEGPKKYYDQFTAGAFDRPIESLVGGLGTTVGNFWENPTEMATGLYNLTSIKPAVDLLSGKPAGQVLQESGQTAGNVWNAISSDYRQSFQEYGVVGGLSHIGSDIVTTVGTAGLGKVPAAIDAAGDAARAGSTLGRLAELGKLGQLSWESYGKVTGGLGDLTGIALGKAGVPDWAAELAGKAAGNAQGSVIQSADTLPADQQPTAGGGTPDWLKNFATSAGNLFGLGDLLS